MGTITDAQEYVAAWIRLAGKPPGKPIVSDVANGAVVTNPYHVGRVIVAPLDDNADAIKARLKEIADIEDTVAAAGC